MAVPPRSRGDRELPGGQVRSQAGDPEGQRRRTARGLQLRRHHRGLRRPVRGRPSTHADRHLPEHQRQPRAVLRTDHRGQAGRATAVPRVLPDHPGKRHPARVEPAQGVQRHDLPGRGRDRGHRRSSRGGLRRRAGGDHDLWAGPRAQERDDRFGRRARTATAGGGRAARRSVDRPADEDRTG